MLEIPNWVPLAFFFTRLILLMLFIISLTLVGALDSLNSTNELILDNAYDVLLPVKFILGYYSWIIGFSINLRVR